VVNEKLGLFSEQVEGDLESCKV